MCCGDDESESESNREGKLVPPAQEIIDYGPPLAVYARFACYSFKQSERFVQVLVVFTYIIISWLVQQVGDWCPPARQIRPPQFFKYSLDPLI